MAAISVKVYGHYFKSMEEGGGAFWYPGLNKDLDSKMSAIVLRLDMAPDKLEGFGHIVDPPHYVYVFRVEKVRDRAGRPLPHYHFIKVSFHDYAANKLNPLDFKNVFLDYKSFLDLYKGGRLGERLKDTADLKIDRSASADLNLLKLYQESSFNYLIFYGPGLDLRSVVNAIFRELDDEVYYTDLVINFPPNLMQTTASMLLAILPDEFEKLYLNKKSVNRNNLKSDLQHHKDLMRTQACEDLKNELKEYLDKLKDAKGEKDVESILNGGREKADELKKAVDDRLCDPELASEVLRAYQKVENFFARPQVDADLLKDAELLKYQLVRARLESAVKNAAQRCLEGQCSENDLAMLAGLANNKELLNEYLESLKDAVRQGVKEGRRLRLEFIRALKERDAVVARRAFLSIMQALVEEKKPLLQKPSDVAERVFDADEFLKVSGLFYREALEDYNNEVKKIEEECNKELERRKTSERAKAINKVFEMFKKESPV